MAFGCDLFPKEKGRCSDASNKHRKQGDPGAFISVFLPGLLEKCADGLFLKMLTSAQLVTHGLLPRQGLGNHMGKLRHREASQDGLPKTHNSFAQPASITGTADDVRWGWSCPGRWGPRQGPPGRGDTPVLVTPAASQSALVLGQWPVRAAASPHVIHGIGMRAFPVTGGRQGPTRRVC